MTPQFQVGDIVEAWGVRGVVREIVGELVFVQVKGVDGIDRVDSFYLDGKYLPWHLKPSLIFISRPKKTRKVEKTIWVNVYPRGERPEAHLSEKDAKGYAVSCATHVAVPFTGTVEEVVE